MEDRRKSDPASGALEGYYLGNLYNDRTNELLTQAQPLLQAAIPGGVALFYSQLMANNTASQFLSSELVQTRLKGSLAQWLTLILTPKAASDISDLVNYQVHVGEVHARIDIPMSLVDTAMMMIKHHFFAAIGMDEKLSAREQVELLICIDSIMTACLSIMDDTYFRGSIQNERVSQEYRTQVSAHDIALEIERVKSNLYGWYTQYVSNAFLKNKPALNLLQTDFGLWVSHKLDLFCDQPEKVSELKQLMERIRQLSEQRLSDQAQIEQAIENIQLWITQAVYLLTLIADQNILSAQQKDALTKLIDRRFLTPILQKETQLALRMKTRYCILMMDIDDFKRVNDVYGHPAGDKVLESVGQVIRQHVRLADYAFRYGGEEILIMLPETQLHDGIKLAERIREQISQTKIVIENQRSLSVTISIGIAEFFDHPDFLRLIQLADQKLYEAKRTGKNRVCH